MIHAPDVHYRALSSDSFGIFPLEFPARLQTFNLRWGQAHEFYPDAGPDRCTAALQPDIDPLQLAHTRPLSIKEWGNRCVSAIEGSGPQIKTLA